MSLKKHYLKSKPVCKVTFKLTKAQAKNAEQVKLVGDFNAWSEQDLPMKRLKNGDFTTTVDLATDRDYQFRYLLNDCDWENDWSADMYVPSPVCYEDNSVVRV